jgi:hypothetical protein
MHRFMPGLCARLFFAWDMRMKVLWGLAFALFSSQPFAQENSTVLGVALGEKLPPKMKMCPAKGEPTELCWREKVKKARDGSNVTYGPVKLPNPSNLPAWAAYTWQVSIEVSGAGKINTLSLSPPDSTEFAEIKQSIISRFGLPSQEHNFPGTGSSAEWARAGVSTSLICGRLGCRVMFYSDDAYREFAKKRDAAIKGMAARPVAP